MTGLSVNADLCIGCMACSSVCIPSVIKVTRNDSIRIIEFGSGCLEDCDKCIQSCPTGALKLQEMRGGDEAVLRLEFNMIACEKCGAYYSTKAMIDYINAALDFDTDWLWTCPRCRQGETIIGVK